MDVSEKGQLTRSPLYPGQLAHVHCVVSSLWYSHEKAIAISFDPRWIHNHGRCGTALHSGQLQASSGTGKTA